MQWQASATLTKMTTPDYDSSTFTSSSSLLLSRLPSSHSPQPSCSLTKLPPTQPIPALTVTVSVSVSVSGERVSQMGAGGSSRSWLQRSPHSPCPVQTHLHLAPTLHLTPCTPNVYSLSYSDYFSDHDSHSIYSAQCCYLCQPDY